MFKKNRPVEVRHPYFHSEAHGCYVEDVKQKRARPLNRFISNAVEAVVVVLLTSVTLLWGWLILRSLLWS